MPNEKEKKEDVKGEGGVSRLIPKYRKKAISQLKVSKELGLEKS